MIKSEFSSTGRSVFELRMNADLVFIGGGIAGTCGAIAAAREGLKVILVQDRPVLGGNASSEVRLWILGATSSMGNNNRWSREGGVLSEILIDNMYRNPDGNAIILDTILLEKVKNEQNLTLLLNTAVYEVVKSADDVISEVIGFCSQNSTRYILSAPYFCDASGDGIVAFQAGAAFRMGAESKDEFDEGFAPDKEYGELLGHSIYFFTKNAGRPITFTAPSYALKDVSSIVKYRSYDISDHGCKLWWLEYGGRLDTIHQTEEIKWELWKVIYGIWDHVKNSGKYPEAENLTLEWVGHIPGKRESRRFEGDYILSQKDVVEQREHQDAVSYGGWSLDLHPADGVFSDRPGCNQWHSKGVYQIPLRCMYSKNIKNLWLAGRIISASHVAFGSARVMATVSYSAQVLGLATQYCLRNGITPSNLANSEKVQELRQELMQRGHFIPGLEPERTNLAHKAVLSASSEFILTELKADGTWQKLEYSTAQLLPVSPGDQIKICFEIDAEESTSLRLQLRVSAKQINYTPEIILESREISVAAGMSTLSIDFDHIIGEEQYVFLCIIKNELVSVQTSKMFLSGTMMLMNRYNKAVATSGVQLPPDGIGIDSFEFWLPSRRPAAQNLAFKLSAALKPFSVSNLINGFCRPTNAANAWVADLIDANPYVTLSWNKTVQIRRIVLFFDSDFDHPLESTLRVHPERVVPHTVRNYKILDAEGKLIFEKAGNYQNVNEVILDEVLSTSSIRIYLEHPSDNVPAALFEVQVFAPC
ncbi:MAG: FAD-dependent oxidoreductase [Daejeonella sp.]|uniref:FAD-dependent oxidoreductase n=1 Tax=Daejeonella sp. TaxID=2805397 RepID=UPI0027336058|nr:FAD-dependent oxidoreductase [Daejeonella sp.]MDP3468525.1 FAD-dependent oxidoreductase [Daejeonella sp.]